MACEDCTHWSFRVDTDAVWGACLSPIAKSKLHISTVKCDIEKKHRKEISAFAEVYTRSDFGCVYFDPDAKAIELISNSSQRCDKTIDLFDTLENRGE